MLKPKEITKRDYSGERMLPSDLFKLEVGMMLKNMSGDDRNPLLVPVEHCHFYHTFDSNGSAQKECSAIGGHKHSVKIEFDKDGQIIDFSCGTPIAFGSNKIETTDKHIHTMTYIKSDKVKQRTRSEEAAKFLLMAGNTNA